jgi:hypothetical protein
MKTRLFRFKDRLIQSRERFRRWMHKGLSAEPRHTDFFGCRRIWHEPF